MDIKSLGSVSGQSLSDGGRNDFAAFADVWHRNNAFETQQAAQVGTSGPVGEGDGLLVNAEEFGTTVGGPNFPTLQSVLDSLRHQSVSGDSVTLASPEEAKGHKGWGSLVQNSVQAQADSGPAGGSGAVSAAAGHFLDTNA